MFHCTFAAVWVGGWFWRVAADPDTGISEPGSHPEPRQKGDLKMVGRGCPVVQFIIIIISGEGGPDTKIHLGPRGGLGMVLGSSTGAE